MARKLKQYTVGEGHARRTFMVYIEPEGGLFSATVDDHDHHAKTLAELLESVRALAASKVEVETVPCLALVPEGRYRSSCPLVLAALMADEHFEMARNPIERDGEREQWNHAKTVKTGRWVDGEVVEDEGVEYSDAKDGIYFQNPTQELHDNLTAMLARFERVGRVKHEAAEILKRTTDRVWECATVDPRLGTSHRSYRALIDNDLDRYAQLERAIGQGEDALRALAIEILGLPEGWPECDHQPTRGEVAPDAE